MPPIVSEEYKERKKKDILESALACFAKKGFEAATMDDIVVHSGTSKGAIYNYFKSKDEIFLELMTTDTSETLDELNRVIAGKKTSLEKVKFLFEEYKSIDPFKAQHLEKAIVHYEFRLYSSRNSDLIEKMEKRREHFFLQLMSTIIKEGQASGEFSRSIEPGLYAEIFWSIIDGATIQTVYEGYPYHSVLGEFEEMYIGKLLDHSN